VSHAAAALFVPGRLCLFGEHSDWAAGYRRTHPEIAHGECLVTGADHGLAAECARDADALAIETRLADGAQRGPWRVRASVAALDAAARERGFFSYAAGVAALITERFGVGGVSLRIRSSLPVGRGLSSSAAICVLVARAYSTAYGLGLSPRDEMELAYQGERRAGSECGRMDQICAFGRRPSLLRFDADALAITPLAARSAIPLLVVDLRAGKDTRRILADLNACFPATPGSVAANVRDALGAKNLALVADARAALERGDAAALGAAMREAIALFDAQVAPACPELAAPKLHAVLAHDAVRRLAHGGKGVGSGGDGCAQLVARGEAERDELAARLERELGVACWKLDLGVVQAPAEA
jgi:galactokinase